MEEVGIDTTSFKAHSVRGASSTPAVEKGVMISDILQKADWSRKSTYLKAVLLSPQAEQQRQLLTNFIV